MSQLPLILKGIEAADLQAVHPSLRFDREYDKLIGLSYNFV